VQALDVIQKGKRVAAASSQSSVEFDSLEVRLVLANFASSLTGYTPTSRILPAG